MKEFIKTWLRRIIIYPIGILLLLLLAGPFWLIYKESTYIKDIKEIHNILWNGF